MLLTVNNIIFSEAEVKITWKNLRQEFGKQLRKIEDRSGDVAAESENVHWPYFKKLLFLQDQFEPYASAGNLPSVELNDGNSESDCQLLTGDPTLSDSQSNFVAYPDAKIGYKMHFTPEAEVELMLLQLEQEKLALEEEKNRRNPNDEDIGFLNSLLPHLKELSPEEKLIFRMKVQQILFEMVYEHKSPTTGVIVTS